MIPDLRKVVGKKFCASNLLDRAIKAVCMPISAQWLQWRCKNWAFDVGKDHSNVKQELGLASVVAACQACSQASRDLLVTRYNAEHSKLSMACNTKKECEELRPFFRLLKLLKEALIHSLKDCLQSATQTLISRSSLASLFEFPSYIQLWLTWLVARKMHSWCLEYNSQ